MCADPEALCRWCATPAPCSAARARRRRWATTWPGPATCCPPFGSARFAGGPAGGRLPEARSTSSRLDEAALDRGGARRGRPGRGRGPRRPRPIGADAPAEGGPLMTVTAPRRARRPGRPGGLPLAPGHGRRPPQHQRVAPTRRRRRCVDAFARGAGRRRRATATPTGPATGPAGRHRRAPRRRPRAGLRGQRLQRGAPDAAPRLRRPRPHGGRVRADLRAARPHRPHHRHRRGRGRAGRRLHPRPRRGAPGARRGPSPPSCSCARPTTPPGWSSRRRRSEAVARPGARRWSWSTRPTASSPRGRRWRWWPTTGPLVVTRTFSKTWSMAACRLGYLVGPAAVVAELEKVVLPYHLDAAKQIAGRLALRFAGEMEARVAALVAERERLAGRPGRPAGRACGRRAPTSSCSGPPAVDGAAVWQGLRRPLGPGARLLVVAPPRRLPAGHRRHPRRGRRLPRPP